jgi:uncharacterized protein (TIGR00269 family)
MMLNRIEEKHTGIKFTIFKSAEKMRPAIEKIAKLEKFRECGECGEPAAEPICKSCQMLKQIM